AGTYEVAPTTVGQSAPVKLNNDPNATAQVTLTWADVAAPQALAVTPDPDPASQDLVRFLNVSSDQLTSGLLGLAGRFQTSAGQGLLGTNVPLIGQSLGAILSGPVTEVRFANGGGPLDGRVVSVSGVVPVLPAGTPKKFVVVVSDVNLARFGV